MGENIGGKAGPVIGHFQNHLLGRISGTDIDALRGKFGRIFNQIAEPVNQFGLPQKLRFAGRQKAHWGDMI